MALEHPVKPYNQHLRNVHGATARTYKDMTQCRKPPPASSSGR